MSRFTPLCPAPVSRRAFLGTAAAAGACASFEENLKGSLTPGKLAELVVLADDPHRVDPDAIKDIAVVRTILGGQTGYEA